ncbi:hypothetical protein [Bordetella genomosp. 13]|uniref:hypothetical protein n=1 Tax=Bordetella genomosp. 13 TaxID=463040 RepID=UPI00119FBD83|nr:hypothetical protein [Bordetella genomosp. 13]
MVAGKMDVEANGIVLLDPEVMHEVLGWAPAPGETRDLMSEFFSSNLGDDVVDNGAVAPLLSIDDGVYEVICRLSSEPSPVEDLVIVTNGVFPLVVKTRAAFFDLQSMMNWPPEESGVDSALAPGIYAVTFRGFRSVEEGRIVRAGYEFVCEPTTDLARPTGQIDACVRVFF